MFLYGMNMSTKSVISLIIWLFLRDIVADTDHVNKPKIKSATGLYGIQGEQLTLNCSVDIGKGVLFTMDWQLPNGNISVLDHRVVKSATRKMDHPEIADLQIGFSTITIHNVDIDKDKGFYKCEVVDHSMNRNSDHILITTLTKDQGSIEIKEPSGSYKNEISSSKVQMVWKIKFKGQPKPTFVWYNNFGEDIAGVIRNRPDKYEINTTNGFTILKIKLLELRDSGFYTLVAENVRHKVEKKFELLVKERPTVKVGNLFVQKNEIAKFVCDCAGYPLSTISWTFTPCSITPEWPNCDSSRRTAVAVGEYINTSDTILTQRSVLTLHATEPGKVECTAVNKEGNGSSAALLEITDIETPFHIWGLVDDTKIAAGDNISLICGASVYNHSSDVNWYLDQQLIESEDNRIVEHYDTEYSYRKKITWNGIKTGDSGTYECRISTIKEGSFSQAKTVSIEVHESKMPQIEGNNLVGDEMQLGEPYRMFCSITGVPDPEVTWYKNGVMIANDTRIHLSADNQTLTIQYVRSEDDGEFKCVGKNRLGSVEKSANLEFSSSSISPAWTIGISVVVSVLVIFIIVMLIRSRREKRRRRQLEADGWPNW